MRYYRKKKKSLITLLMEKFVLFLLKKFRKTENPTLTTDQNYFKKKYLLTEAERNFFTVLFKITKSNNWLVFAKVGISDLLYTPRKKPGWQARWNKIQSKHVDFVICDSVNIAPLLAIELDDSSHQEYNRQKSDEVKNQVFHDASFPLLRQKVQWTYNKTELEKKIKNHTKPQHQNLTSINI